MLLLYISTFMACCISEGIVQPGTQHQSFQSFILNEFEIEMASPITVLYADLVVVLK